MARLVLVGGGRMGEALLGGLLSAGWADATELCVVEKLADRRSEYEKRFPGVVVVAEPLAADGAVVAVKPDDVPADAPLVTVASGGCCRSPRASRSSGWSVRLAPASCRAARCRTRRRSSAWGGRDRAGHVGIRGRSRLGRGHPRRRRHGRPRQRVVARRRHRAVWIRPGLCVPCGRGAHRRRRARRAAARREHVLASRRCSEPAGCSPRPATRPRRFVPPLRRPVARPRPDCVRSKRPACARRSSTQSPPPPSALAS